MSSSIQEIPWSFSELSALRCEFARSTSSRSTHFNIMRIRFIGGYGVGCKGSSDADFMCAMTAGAIAADQPEGLILDFSELDYKWGDDLERVFNYVGGHPFAVLLGEQSREAFISLVCQVRDLKEVEEWTFDSFEEAWIYVNERVSRR